MSRAILLSLSFLIVGLFLQSKDVPEKTNTYTIYVNFEDYSVRANVLYNADKVKPKMFRTYYWYMNNDIKKTDGSFDGKLLHGEYKSFYRNLNLREQGNFNYGLKDGIWKTWYMNGKIHELSNYKNGLEQGTLEVYDEQGYIVSKTNFKNGIKNGKMVYYQNNKIDSVIIYKKGEPKQPKPNRSFLRLNKNKEKDTTENETKKTDKAKDTIAGAPKSSFKFKKIFNKNPKDTEQAKPEAKKEIPTKKKETLKRKKDSADKTTSKKS